LIIFLFFVLFRIILHTRSQPPEAKTCQRGILRASSKQIQSLSLLVNENNIYL